MTKILGLHGHNFIDGTETLTAVWAKTPMVYKSGSWIRGGNLTANQDAYLASYINRVFLVNGNENLEYNNVDWRSDDNFAGSPIAKFIISSDSYLFLYNITINGVRYPSRVWLSDLPQNNKLTWGLDWGNDLVTTASDATIDSASGHFKDWNIKVGDPFFITSGTNRGHYTVLSVTSNTELELTENLVNTSSGDSFWTGGNWFDVGTENGDAGNGFGIASNEVVCFKKDSVYRYNVSGTSLRRIKDVPGTTSPKSIVEWGGYSYWYHPSGIYRTSAGTGEWISGKIDDIIDGVTTANQTQVVSWINKIEKTINMYLGNVTLRSGDTISNCVATLDTTSNIWTPRSYNMIITAATNWLHSSVPEVYVGDDDSGVHQIDTGTSFNTADIPFSVEYWPEFPAGEDAVVTFNRVRAFIDNGPDVQLLYKLYYMPTENEDVFINDTEWHPMTGSQVGERCDWYFPSDTRAAGVALKAVQSGADESFLIEKFTIYYSMEANN
jgi:hypothetical protein